RAFVGGWKKSARVPGSAGGAAAEGAAEREDEAQRVQPGEPRDRAESRGRRAPHRTDERSHDSSVAEPSRRRRAANRARPGSTPRKTCERCLAISGPREMSALSRRRGPSRAARRKSVSARRKILSPGAPAGFGRPVGVGGAARAVPETAPPPPLARMDGAQ